MIANLKKAKIRLIAATLMLFLLSACSTANNPIQSSATEPNHTPEVSDSQQSLSGGQTSASAQASTSPVVAYEDTDYGFTFNLPADWEGYSIIDGEWEGLAPGGESGEKVVDAGPMISIRDPRWKSESPRQDIPIMIFTLDQWEALQNGDFHIGAAPVGPSELGRNNKYVFALPARYNFSFPKGYEEVEEILGSEPLVPTNLPG